MGFDRIAQFRCKKSSPLKAHRKNMKVHIHPFANLRDYAPTGKKSFELSLADGATVADVFATLRIPATVEAVILVNGRRVDQTTPLAAGDEVTLFPPMEGG
jgi:molybdopterin converting factor small subunit